MIKAICDKCGKEFTLLYSEYYGLESPSGWALETGYFTPLKRGYDYRTFCPECKPRKEAKE